MRNLTEVSTYTANVQVPENGDVVAAETSDPAFQALANRTKFLNDARVAHDARITTLEGFDADTRLNVLEGRFNAGGELVFKDATGAPVTNQGIYWIAASKAKLIGAVSVFGPWDVRFEDGDVLGGVSQAFFDLTEHLPRSHNAKIVRIRVLVTPRAARASGSRISAVLKSAYFGVSFDSPSLTISTEATAEDDGTTNLQWILLDFSGAPLSIIGKNGWGLEVSCNDVSASDVSPDRVHAVAVEIGADGIGVI